MRWHMASGAEAVLGACTHHGRGWCWLVSTSRVSQWVWDLRLRASAVLVASNRACGVLVRVPQAGWHAVVARGKGHTRHCTALWLCRQSQRFQPILRVLSACFEGAFSLLWGCCQLALGVLSACFGAVSNRLKVSAYFEHTFVPCCLWFCLHLECQFCFVPPPPACH